MFSKVRNQSLWVRVSSKTTNKVLAKIGVISKQQGDPLFQDFWHACWQAPGPHWLSVSDINSLPSGPPCRVAQTVASLWAREQVRETSLVVWWLKISLPMQETRVRSLVWKDHSCHGTTKPLCRNYWAHITTEAWNPRTHALQQEKLPREACTLQLESSLCSLQAEKACMRSSEDPVKPKIKIN